MLHTTVSEPAATCHPAPDPARPYPRVIRRARKTDARRIAELFGIASDGVAKIVWSGLDIEMSDRELLDIGERRYAREGELFSYEKCFVAESCHGDVIAMVHGYVVEGEPLPLGADLPEVDVSDVPDVLRPYALLEWPGSYYISGVAAYPYYRNRGIGRALLERAEAETRSVGIEVMSLIAFEANEDARRLYRREGWVDVARQPIVPDARIHHAHGDAILMLKDLAGR